MKKPKIITVVGRQWWHKLNGYTVQTATIIVDGIEIGDTKRSATYGCAYLYDAFYELERLGHLKLKRLCEYSRESPYSWAERNNCKLTTVLVRVGRKKDL